MVVLTNKVVTPVKMDMVDKEENHPGFHHQDLVMVEDLVAAVALALDLLVLLVVLVVLAAVVADTKIIVNLILMEQTVWVVAPVVVAAAQRDLAVLEAERILLEILVLMQLQTLEVEEEEAPKATHPLETQEVLAS